MRAASVAKLLASEAAIANASTAVQVLGGMGFTWDMLPNHLLKRAWVLEHAFGAADDHAASIGAALVAAGERENMSYQDIVYEVADRTATITLDRPEALNALSPNMVEELRHAYAAAERDDDVWTLVVTGNGRAFCTGADVGKIPDDGRVPHPEPYLSTLDQWEAPQEGTPPFRTMTKPVITAVNGLCCGAGLDWVTTGDITIASDQAQFFDPHVSIGLVSGREMVRLARVLPTGIAMRIALTGRHERVSAAARLRARDDLRGRRARPSPRAGPRDRRAGEQNAPLAVRGTRLAIKKTLDLPLHEAEILAEAFRERVLRTDDAKEGPRAFMEKRDPRWTAS